MYGPFLFWRERTDPIFFLLMENGKAHVLVNQCGQ